MSGRAQKVLGDALDLTDEERAEVALEVVASLDGPRDLQRSQVLPSRSSSSRPSFVFWRSRARDDARVTRLVG